MNQFTDEELFKFEQVEVDLKPEDLPGKPIGSTFCEECGEKILDGRFVEKDGKTLCKTCAGDSYYKVIAARS